MAKKTLLFSATMSLTAGIREKLELLAHTSQDDSVDEYCDNMVEQLDTIDGILGVLFNTPSPAKEKMLIEDEQRGILVEAERAIVDAQKLFVDAKTDEQIELAEEAIAKAEDTLENLRLEGDFDFD